MRSRGPRLAWQGGSLFGAQGRTRPGCGLESCGGFCSSEGVRGFLRAWGDEEGLVESLISEEGIEYSLYCPAVGRVLVACRVGRSETRATVLCFA